MNRFTVVFLCILLAILVLIIGFLVDPNSPWGNILFNLSSEIIGIAFTVAIIDVIFERRQKREQSTRTAKFLLSEINKFVHEWLNEGEEFTTEESIKLLQNATKISKTRKIRKKRYNIAILDALGQTANTILLTDEDSYKSMPELREALEQLSTLHQMKIELNLDIHKKQSNYLSEKDTSTILDDNKPLHPRKKVAKEPKRIATDIVAEKLSSALRYLVKASGEKTFLHK